MARGRADAYLTKPVEPEELIAHINALLRIRRAEKALVESEERYRDLFDNANDIVYTHEHVRAFHVDQPGRRARHRLHAPRAAGPKRSTSFCRVIRGAELVDGAPEDSRRRPDAYELEIQPKNGQRLTLEVSSRLIERQGKPVGVQGIARDISDRKRLEEQLRQAQKMEAIGRLAGGVAHDFNNLLTGIIGYSELILHRLPPGHALAPDVEGIRHAAERAAGLTYQLLAFSRKQLLAPKVLNLNNVLVDLVRMLERLIREDIKLFLELEPNLERSKWTLCSFSKSLSIWLSMPADAMPRGGQLTLATANIDLDGGLLGPGKPDRPVRDAVGSRHRLRHDRGSPRQAVRAVLSPPRTSARAPGSVCPRSTASSRQSGGHIDVVSAPGTGTTFKICLPCYESMVALGRPATQTPSAGDGNETVLVVEDEEMVRKVICLVLAKHGYHVLQAPDGHRALRLCEGIPRRSTCSSRTW